MNTMFEDDKIEYIESLPDGDSILVIWVKTLCLASKCNDNGNLMITNEIPYTAPLLANKFKKSATDVQYALGIMEKLGMIEVIDDVICISNWCKYQSVDELAKIKEQTRLRVAKCREKKKLLGNATSNATETQNCNDIALISNSISIEEIKNYFEKTYKIYPKSTSKEKARTVFEHKLYGMEKQEAESKAIKIYRYLEQAISEWQAENDGKGRKLEFIPTFANWLDDNIADSPNFKGKKK